MLFSFLEQEGNPCSCSERLPQTRPVFFPSLFWTFLVSITSHGLSVLFICGVMVAQAFFQVCSFFLSLFFFPLAILSRVTILVPEVSRSPQEEDKILLDQNVQVTLQQGVSVLLVHWKKMRRKARRSTISFLLVACLLLCKDQQCVIFLP